MTDPEPGTVECYSGHTFAGEPRTVVWSATRYDVVEVQSRWRTPSGPAFRIRTAPGQHFELHYDEQADRWAVRPVE